MYEYTDLRALILVTCLVSVNGFCSSERELVVQACQDNSATGSIVNLDSGGAINDLSANCQCVFSHNENTSRKLVFISAFRNSFSGVEFEIGCRTFLDPFSQESALLETGSQIIFRKNTTPARISAGLCQAITSSFPLFNFTITCYANNNGVNSNPDCSTTQTPTTTTPRPTTTTPRPTTTTPRPTTTTTTISTPRPTTTMQQTTTARQTTTQSPTTRQPSTEASVTTRLPVITTTQRDVPTTQSPVSTETSSMDDDDDNNTLDYIIIAGACIGGLLFLIVAIAAVACGRSKNKDKEETSQYLHPQPIDESDYYTRDNEAYIAYEGAREERQYNVTQTPVENSVVHVPLSVGYVQDDNAMYASVVKNRPSQEAQYVQQVIEHPYGNVQSAVEEPFGGNAVYYAEDDDFPQEHSDQTGVARVYVNNDHVDY